MTVVHTLRLRISPSILARKIVCPAYVAAPFQKNDRFLFQALHAMAVLKVLRRHLKLGYRLKSIEKRGHGFRIDLSFISPSGRIRVNEVKSAKQLGEVHRIQAALYYWGEGCDEVVLSNGDVDIVLPEDYIYAVQKRAHETLQLLTQHPDIANVSFNPKPEVCRTCANAHCPFLPGNSRHSCS